MYYDELYHHGILGQKWGVRRYQNKDGSYKPGAEGRYDGDDIKNKLSAAKKSLKEAKNGLVVRKAKKHAEKAAAKEQKQAEKEQKRAEKVAAKEQKQAEKEAAKKEFHLSDRQKKALKIGAAAVGTALAVYGAKKLYDHIDATKKGKLLAEKLLSENRGDLEGAVRSLGKREGNLQREWSFGTVKKADHEKLKQIHDATKKNFQDRYRQTLDPYKEINELKNAARAQRKDRFDKATKNVRDVAGKGINKAKTSANQMRGKAAEAGRRAKSTYERKAGESMAKAINRDYARRQAINKAKSSIKSGANSARKRAGETQSYLYGVTKDLRRRKR